MSATIHIPDDRLTQSILGFIEDSPLSYCTTVGFEAGSRVVRTDRPVSTLSTSERLLWDLLASVTTGDLRALINHADDRTAQAITDLFAGFEMTGRAA